MATNFLPIPSFNIICWRSGPISGRYEGYMTSPDPNRFFLELRVDIDSRYPNSPVLNAMSGDLYDVFQFGIYRWKRHSVSWKTISPSIRWSRCKVEIDGQIWYEGDEGWSGAFVNVVIPWKTRVSSWPFSIESSTGPAIVTMTILGGPGSSVYVCDQVSIHFRDLTLEVDVAASVNAEPILPRHDTHSDPVHPPNLQQRILTVEEAYREAGLAITIDPDRTIIDDSDPGFTTWSDTELHDVMEQHFRHYSGTWPKWRAWGVLAGLYDDNLVMGVMFDSMGGFLGGGAKEPPDRQGFAIFRDHPNLGSLVPEPANQFQAQDMRQYLFAYVHEIGHVLNLRHSDEKGRPESLSWMNNPQEWAWSQGENFWLHFEFSFDTEELFFLRHGFRSEVMPGGADFGSATNLRVPFPVGTGIEGEVPIRFRIDSKPYFRFMEPVRVELQLRNVSEDAMNLSAHLNPELGKVKIFVRRPDGNTLEFVPLIQKYATHEPLELEPSGTFHRSLLLSYGQYGFYFDVPGEYLIFAIYTGLRGTIIRSNIHRIRVGNPVSLDDERLAVDYYSHETGVALYLKGSSSPFLEKGMNTLRELAVRNQDNATGAYISFILAQNLRTPFFRLKDGKMELFRDRQPREALDLVKQAISHYDSDPLSLSDNDYAMLKEMHAQLEHEIG